MFRQSMQLLARHKFYHLINIAGLAVGFAASFLILLYVIDEVSFDRQHPDAERLYRLSAHVTFPTGGTREFSTSPPPAARGLREGLADIEASGRYAAMNATVRRGHGAVALTLAFVDSGFVDMFNLPTAASGARRALDSRQTIVLTRQTARRLFGDRDPVGQTLAVHTDQFERDYIVGAVIDTPPANMAFRFSALAPLVDDDPDIKVFPGNNWNSFGTVHTFVRLRRGADAGAVGDAARDFVHKRGADSGGDTDTGEFMQTFDWYLEPLLDHHFSPVGNGSGFSPKGNRTLLLALLGVAALLLLAAGVNFTNLGTALASLRARDAAVRRVMGATRGGLVRQHLGESVIAALVALMLALALMEIALPWFNSLTGKAFQPAVFLTGAGIAGLPLPVIYGGLAVVSGLIAGLYPAINFAATSPASLLVSGTAGRIAGGGRLRGALVIVQFALTAGLIAGGVIVTRQLDYLTRLDRGFDSAGVLVLGSPASFKRVNNMALLQQRLSDLPGVIAAGRSSTPLANGYLYGGTAYVKRNGAFDGIGVQFAATGPGFFGVYGLSPLAGRTLGASDILDKEAEAARRKAGGSSPVVVSRAALKTLGIADPAAAIGITFRMAFGQVFGIAKDRLPLLEIVGVVPDIHTGRLTVPDAPVVYATQKRLWRILVLRFRTPDVAGLIENIRGIWEDVNPTDVMEFNFADDIIRDQYKTERLQQTLLDIAAAITLAIAAMGLLAMAAFMIERRRREISLRKLLGARRRDIAGLLLWQFSKLVLIANLIAAPLAWWGLNRWLAGFAWRIEVGLWPFAAIAAVTLAASWLVILYQVMLAARRLPARELRHI